MSIIFFAIGCVAIYKTHCGDDIKLVCVCILCAMAMLCVEIAKCRDTYATANPIKGDGKLFKDLEDKNE